MFRSLSLPALLLCSALPLAAAVDGNADKPSWHALPRETIAALRLPDLSGFLGALEGTRFGRALTDEARWKGLRELISEASEGEFEAFLRQLEQRGFTPKDWRALVTGEIGCAVVMLTPDEPDDGPPVALLAWLEPSADLGQRLMHALDQGLHDPAIPPERRPTRIDERLNDHEVIHLSIPRLKRHHHFDDATGEMTHSTEPGEPQHVYLHRRGTRFILGTGSQQIQQQDLEQVFGRFLAAHDGADGAFVGRVLQAPGVHDGIPRGIPLFETYGDLSTLWTVLAAEEELSDGMSGQRFLDVTGLAAHELLSMGLSLDGGLLRSNAFIDLPAPRRGIPAMLELPQHPGEPAAWAPASAQEYSHFGIDLLKLYTQIKELSFALGGDEAMRSFEMAEGGVMGMVGVDLTALLGAFGTRIEYVVYPMGQVDPDNLAAGSNRFGLAIEIADPELITQVLRSAALMSGGQMVEEQGFQGFRLPLMPAMPPGGVFLGHGRLIFAMGANAVEQTLAAIRKPPEGDASLRNAPLLRRAAQLLVPQPSITWSVQDIGALMRSMATTLPMMITQQTMGDPEQEAMTRRFLELMPSAEDWDSYFGLGVSQLRINDLGLVFEGVSELPLATE